MSEAIDKLSHSWQTVMAMPAGQFIRKDLEYYATRQSHVPGDPYATAFQDGQRMLAQTILDLATKE